MDSKEFKELLKKCFGKQKDNRYHAIAMLIIYAFFLFVLILAIRVSGSTNLENDSVNKIPELDLVENEDDVSPIDSKIVYYNNYSYSYTITYNGSSEVFLGKKTANKEKFTYIKNNTMTDYAILNDNYFILNNGTYQISEKLSRNFKYCNVRKLLVLLDNKVSDSVSNTVLANTFDDNILIDNNKFNTISIDKQNDILKSMDLDLSNYISALEGTNSTLIIHIELNDIGEIDDFEININ